MDQKRRSLPDNADRARPRPNFSEMLGVPFVNFLFEADMRQDKSKDVATDRLAVAASLLVNQIALFLRAIDQDGSS